MNNTQSALLVRKEKMDAMVRMVKMDVMDGLAQQALEEIKERLAL
jgi:hypothetical protein